jgi:hypothetical protein
MNEVAQREGVDLRPSTLDHDFTCFNSRAVARRPPGNASNLSNPAPAVSAANNPKAGLSGSASDRLEIKFDSRPLESSYQFWNNLFHVILVGKVNNAANIR